MFWNQHHLVDGFLFSKKRLHLSSFTSLSSLVPKRPCLDWSHQPQAGKVLRYDGSRNVCRSGLGSSAPAEQKKGK